MHPNGFLPIKTAAPGASAWNLGLCSCGALKDARADRCRGCYKAWTSKVCPACGTDRPRADYWFRKNGQVISRCKDCYRKAPSRYVPGRPRDYKKASARLTWRRQNDLQFKLALIYRSHIRSALRGGKKVGHSSELMGCSIAEFRAHIEVQWLPGMGWNNWGRGRGRWNLDHRRPVASFDMTAEADVRACFHFTNYQPLWASDNAAKGAKWTPAA